VSIVYLHNPDDTLENFNKILVEAGQACVWNFSNNEFNPADWWGGQIRATGIAVLTGIILESRLTGLLPNLTSWFTPGTLISNSETYKSLRYLNEIL
jgi:hypothetical protein